MPPDGTSRSINFDFRWIVWKAKAPKSYDLQGYDFVLPTEAFAKVGLTDTQVDFVPTKVGTTSTDAEEEGFEPPEPCGSTVFKTAALDRSATPLCYLNYFLIF